MPWLSTAFACTDPLCAAFSNHRHPGKPLTISTIHDEPVCSCMVTDRLLLELQSGEDQAKSSPQPRQPKPAAISPQLWAAIQAPLQMHMLRKLPPPSLAAARRSCQAFQQLIDTAPADFLFPCMRHLLPHGMEVHASTGCDLLDMLGGQQALISNLRSGHSGRVMMTDKHMRQESEVHWPPSYPSRYALISSNTKKLLTLPGGAQGSVTDFTELHVLDASGKSGPSSWGTAVPELKVPGEVQWIYACHESGIMLVDSWDCTDQRLLQVLDITSQGSPPRTQRSRYGMPPSALSISNGLVLLAMDGYVQVLDMSNLDEMCRVHPCSSPTASGFSEASDSCHSDPHPDWCNWSADGSLFAVAWGECGSFLGGVITIYNTLSHAAVGQSTVPLCRSDSEIAHLEYTWSPSAPLILVKAVSSTADEGPRQGRVTIIDHDGRCRFLEFCLEMVDCLAGWSSCGRFMHFIIDKDLSLTEERGAGYIWDTISRQRVFNWRVGTPGLKSHSIVWASAAAKEAACFIHSCSVILTWAPGGDGIPRISSLWPHAEASPAALSPCGRVHISKWSVPRPTASYTIPSWQANNVSSNNIPRLSQLWHSVLRPGHDSCSMQMVEALAGRWHLDSVAWHPNPAAGAIYAIMHSSGDVMLIDGLQHAIISSWPRPRMFPTAEEPLEAEAFVCLQWSPDGTKLLVAIDNDCAVICFGGIVGPIPTSKRVQKG